MGFSYNSCYTIVVGNILVVVSFVLQYYGCATEAIDVHVGVVLDLNSSLGSMADLCMKMAISDFYEANSNYTTRLKLHTKSAQTVFDVNNAVMDLVKHDNVHGIIGPQKYTDDAYAAELGGNVQMPIISFTARTSSLPFPYDNYYVRTTIDDAYQAQALAAIFREFGWPEIVVLYEDTKYGNQFLSHLNKALQAVDVGLAYMVAIPLSVTDSDLQKEMERLTRKQTRVFLLHMNPSLGYRLFTSAKKVGVTSEGYAWIISDSLSNFMNSMGSSFHDSMEGVLGVRPYLYHSKERQDFQERWKRNMLLANTASSGVELNVYGLWAYDTITALAIAAEMIAPVSSNSFYWNTPKDGTDNTKLKISTFGPELLNQLSVTKFRGLSGEFKLAQGKLEQSTFEIFNVYGSGEKVIGFWTPDNGISRELLTSHSDSTYSTSIKELKAVIWPGESLVKPKGWAIPTTNNLRVGIPWKSGFTEFVNVIHDPARNLTNATGFAIDIFLRSLDLLPFPIYHEFHHYNGTEHGKSWTYDDMLEEIPKKFDMVVGDTTIWAWRASHVDFSLPYCGAEIILVVRNKKPFDMWIFIKPFRLNLWIAIIIACILMGVVLRLLELQVAKTSEDSVKANNGKHGNIYMSPITVLAFPERNMVTNNWSFFVLVFWLFMAFVLMQSYTANLSAILTVDQLKFKFSNNAYVGCQEQSFMKKFLMENLDINASRLKTYRTLDEYHAAMSLGSKRGGIDVIFDEVPYMKLFCKKYDSQYKMVGPTYKTGGLGFAFPIGSPLASHFSRAILKITQSPDLTAIELKNFGPGYSSQDPLSSTVSQGTSSLTLYDFGGLFLIIGIVTIFSLFCSTTLLGRKINTTVMHFVGKCFKFKTSPVIQRSSSVTGVSTQRGFEEPPASVQDGDDCPIPNDDIDGHVPESSLHYSNDDEVNEIIQRE